MMRFGLFGLLILVFCAAAPAQTLERYTEASGEYALGYPVPIPVASLTPVDGFRDYASLHARHQQLAAEHDFISAHRIGETHQGRAIWAYRFGRGEPGADGRGVAIVNGAIHAREWQSPEVVTGLFEALAQRGASNDAVVGWLLDNIDIWVLPVLNVDGFAQTQRYPTEVIVGRDPRVSGWPRDGRMRRKNMLSVDSEIDTFNDHLRGVDLNRNNPPKWSSGVDAGGSSNNPSSLVYHGSAPASEPETQALQALAELAGEEAIRFYVDTHSFTQLFYVPQTDNVARNSMARNLNQGMREVLAANGVAYGRSISPADETIGSTDEMFAWLYDAPSYTLELEPGSNGGQQYGGFGVTHDGFILPESEIDRVRRQHVPSFLFGFYRQASPPWLASVSLYDSQGERVYHGEWLADGGQRRLDAEQSALLPGASYRLQLRFSKPMRSDSNDTTFNVELAEVTPSLAWVDLDGLSAPAETVGGQWLSAQAGLDTFETEITLPDSDAVLRVDMRDLAGQQLDAVPAQPVGWSQGTWRNYQDEDGVGGSIGGTDQNHLFEVASITESDVGGGIWWDPARDGEGVELLLARNGDQRLLAVLWYHYDAEGQPRWWLSETVALADSMQLELRQYDQAGERVGVGQAELTFLSGRSLRMAVQLGDNPDAIVRELRPFDFGGAPTDPAFTGAWYDPGDPGWGITISDRADQRVSVVYYYDADGLPRWALASGQREADALALRHFTGACLRCEAQPPARWEEPGDLRWLGENPLGVDVDLSYPGGGEWQRRDVVLERLTGGG